ncbi:MAG TPA: hypothetical protein DDY77_01745 [Clostridiales bacterium]|nr:hypothetical protein [Clostridiales bacterium]
MHKYYIHFDQNLLLFKVEKILIICITAIFNFPFSIFNFKKSANISIIDLFADFLKIFGF